MPNMHMWQFATLNLHVIAQHQLLGIRMQVDLLMYPTLRWAQAPTLAPGSGVAVHHLTGKDPGAGTLGHATLASACAHAQALCATVDCH